MECVQKEQNYKYYEKDEKENLTKSLLKKRLQRDLLQAQKFFETYKKEFIPVSHDIKKWNTFLPPLQNFQAEAVSSLGSGYKEGLLAMIKSGNFKQYKDIGMLQGKIFYFSLSFIEKIQRVVKEKSAILKSGNDEAFLENACCSTTEYNVLKYFIEENRSIVEDNENIIELDKMLADIRNSGKGVAVIYDKDTKLKYPIIQKQFSEEVIFLAFILYCKFNKKIPISEDLRRICVSNESSFSDDDSIADKIEKLKSEGRQFDERAFRQLLMVVEKTGIINMQLSGNDFEIDERLLEVIGGIETNDEEYILGALIRQIRGLMESYGENYEKDSESIRNLKNYLGRANMELENEILTFIQKNSGISKKKMRIITEFLNNFEKWKLTGDQVNQTVEDETNFKFINFARNAIYMISNVIPNIIINEVDYSSVRIPRHWKLSDRHMLDIQKIIENNYKSLSQFYEKERLLKFCKRSDQLSKTLCY